MKPSKKSDVFYDLGCGYGRVCIWSAHRVKLSVGFENHYDRYRRAKWAVESSGLKNVEIRYANFSHASYKNATIVYSMLGLVLYDLARINRQSKNGTILIQYWRPNYPVKARRVSGNYFMMKTPLKRVKDEDEFARMVLGRKKAGIEDLNRKLTREDRISLKREIHESDSEWKRLFIT
ncbi:MAG: hypothetical protein ACREBS_07050 [Nitrososphaerales archaeon]